MGIIFILTIGVWIFFFFWGLIFILSIRDMMRRSKSQRGSYWIERHAPLLQPGRLGAFDLGSENVGRLYDIIVVGKFWRGSRILMAIATIIMSGSLAYWLYLLIYRIDQESEYFDPLSGPIILILIIVGLIWMAALGIEQYIISRDGILRRNPVAGDLFIKWQDFASVSIAASGKQADEWRFKFKFADQTVEFNAGGKDSWYIAENISKNIPRDRWINPVFVESCIEIAQKKQKY